MFVLRSQTKFPDGYLRDFIEYLTCQYFYAGLEIYGHQDCTPINRLIELCHFLNVRRIKYFEFRFFFYEIS